MRTKPTSKNYSIKILDCVDKSQGVIPIVALDRLVPVVQALIDEYATKQSAIVAAEKDKEINELNLQSAVRLATIKEANNQLSTKEAECQRLRDELIQLKK